MIGIWDMELLFWSAPLNKNNLAVLGKKNLYTVYKKPYCLLEKTACIPSKKKPYQILEILSKKFIKTIYFIRQKDFIHYW